MKDRNAPIRIKQFGKEGSRQRKAVLAEAKEFAARQHAAARVVSPRWTPSTEWSRIYNPNVVSYLL
ncbi:protein of unknown function [Acidithiobacillus ferrivorans]|jgi:hypothetical protein|uniref:Uncharacterized protein n=1 Tax=Acidithiobacillus ferrivorans TaxID=160808 RepID=A0A060UUW7_9PROT|nr:hypothetical protein [Acidithiobacillus ferrivorans]QQD73976.1 hypothetical protein H2515_07075 [Acidithiobacillus ferrivorans]CDQ10364.1 hypothetical protein AFERRI_400145 [Acidithiobacillus ferrivorans]SMH64391.1 protein of unknown function [Acidithiobacillus ferrivorans]